MATSDSIPGKAVINHEAGDTLVRTYTITEGGGPVDFTGSTVDFIISLTEDATALLITTAAAGSNLTAGEIKISMQTSTLEPKKTYWYKLKVTFPDGVIKTYIEDKLKTT